MAEGDAQVVLDVTVNTGAINEATKKVITSVTAFKTASETVV